MQLKRVQQKPEYSNEPQQYKPSPPVDWKIHQINYDAEIPHGKHIGKTVEDIQEEDEWYWQWMWKANIWANWGLLQRKKEPEKKKQSWVGTRWDDEYIAVGLRQTEQKGIPCPEYWYK